MQEEEGGHWEGQHPRKHRREENPEGRKQKNWPWERRSLASSLETGSRKKRKDADKFAGGRGESTGS